MLSALLKACSPNQIIWPLTAVAPAATRILLLLILARLSIPNDDFATLINTSCLVAVYLTASLGIAAVSTQRNSISGLVVTASPLLLLYFANDSQWELCYVLSFSAYQILRFIYLAKRQPKKALALDLIFIIPHILTFYLLESIYTPHLILALSITASLQSLIILRSLTPIDLAASQPKDNFRSLLSGISNLSTSGLVFALPLIMESKLASTLVSEATIVSTLAFITTLAPRSYVSSVLHTTTTKITRKEFDTINKTLYRISIISFAITIIPISMYSLYTLNTFIFLYGVLVSGYTAIGQLSSYNSNIIMMNGDTLWLAKWNAGITALLLFYFHVSPDNSPAFFLTGLVLLTVAYHIRVLTTKEKAHEWLVH